MEEQGSKSFMTLAVKSEGGCPQQAIPNTFSNRKYHKGEELP